MFRILILKTAALGDVLRTTAVLPGLCRRHPGCHVTWLTAADAVDLVRFHRLVDEVVSSDRGIAAAADRLGAGRFDRVLSFDDEVEPCRLASRLARAGGGDGVLSGAYLDDAGERRYTDDVAPWFDMGLLSAHGREEADRRKKANPHSHPAIFARMLGVEMGAPELPLPDTALARAAELAARWGLGDDRPWVGLNTGAGGRWESKRLPVGRTAELAVELDRRLGGRIGFVLLGGPQEAERNASIRRALEGSVRLIDAGTSNPVLDFAALIDRLDLLVTSDSLGLHVAIARRVPPVVFFAPTSAAEVELYGRGEKVVSTAPDACSYRADADTSTLTVARLADAALRVLGAGGEVA